ncbi:Mitochondrial carnitine/acylcarnitine carrier protein CACL [Dirofilaria immitis]|nr:Mitochondrial carnitine/acylcarnitine carrier protein CACL [Dirofilaria immitis]
MITVGYCSDHYDRKFEQYGYFEPVLHYLIGVIAGASGVLTGHPLDTIRIRQQIEVQNVYRCCALIIRNEGFLGFFKGMSSPLVSFSAIHAIAFGVYGNTIKIFDNYHNLFGSFIAGNMAGIAQCTICIPADLLKIKLQLQKDEKRRLYTSSYDCAQKMIKQHGFLSIFKGSWITIARDGPGYGMWFVTYDFCTQKLSKNGTAQSLTASQLLLAGSIAGIMSWICNYPLDVIKTQFQANDNIYSYRQACQNIMRTYGIKGFFAGFSATIMRAIPANASIFFAAEWSYRLLDIISEWHETRFPKNPRINLKAM